MESETKMVYKATPVTHLSLLKSVARALVACLLPFLIVPGSVAQAVGAQDPPPASPAGDRTFTFPADKTEVPVPFELLANGVFVSAQLNGKGPFLFDIDTGSFGSVLSAELVDELGLKLEGTTSGMGAGGAFKMGVVRGKIEFTLPGEMKLATEDANTIPMAGLWPLIGRRFYGIIGYDVLKDLAVEFNYEKKLVTFHSPASYKYSGKGQTFDATLQMGYDPQFAGSITVPGLAPIAAKFTVDTGAGGTVITAPLVKANHLLEKVLGRDLTLSQGAAGGETNDLLGRIESVELGPYKLQRPLVSLSQDTDGALAMEGQGVNLGGNLLRRFTLIIDYPRSKVVLEPNSHFADPFPADASGIVLQAEGSDFKRFVVRGIVAGSPAAQAGLQEGDVITAVDGKAGSSYALWELQEILKKSGHVVRLALQRGTKFLTCDLTLRPLA